MKKTLFLMSLFALVLVGAGCDRSFDWDFGDSDYQYDDYAWGDYDSIPSAELTVPVSVVVGESFDIVAHVTHNADENQLLHSIDIGESYLEGIAITSSTPDFSESYYLDDGTYTHTLLTDVPAGDGVDIVFHAVALESGNWKGAFDVCFDDGINCSFYTVSTFVN